MITGADLRRVLALLEAIAANIDMPGDRPSVERANWLVQIATDEIERLVERVEDDEAPTP